MAFEEEEEVNCKLKGTVSRDFFLLFFYESVSPQPQSTANFATSFASVVDTGGKFAAGNDTGGNLPQV
jgi:hypothetical protein